MFIQTKTLSYNRRWLNVSEEICLWNENSVKKRYQFSPNGSRSLKQFQWKCQQDFIVEIGKFIIEFIVKEYARQSEIRTKWEGLLYQILKLL